MHSFCLATLLVIFLAIKSISTLLYKTEHESACSWTVYNSDILLDIQIPSRHGNKSNQTHCQLTSNLGDVHMKCKCTNKKTMPHNYPRVSFVKPITVFYTMMPHLLASIKFMNQQWFWDFKAALCPTSDQRIPTASWRPVCFNNNDRGTLQLFTLFLC